MPVYVMQMFVDVLKELARDVPLPASPYTPWRFGNPQQLLQDLKEANFSNVECTSYRHDMTFTVPDIIEFQVGPHGQSRPALDMLKSLGRDNIDEEAPKVACLGLTTGLCCTKHGQNTHSIHRACVVQADIEHVSLAIVFVPSGEIVCSSPRCYVLQHIGFGAGCIMFVHAASFTAQFRTALDRSFSQVPYSFLLPCPGHTQGA